MSSSIKDLEFLLARDGNSMSDAFKQQILKLKKEKGTNKIIGKVVNGVLAIKNCNFHIVFRRFTHNIHRTILSKKHNQSIFHGISEDILPLIQNQKLQSTVDKEKQFDCRKRKCSDSSELDDII